MSWFRARSVFAIAVGLLLLGMGAVGCSSNANNPYLDLGPTPTATTQTFTGTLDNSGDVPILRLTHTFTTTYDGTVTITLTANAPDASLLIGFGIGVWDSTASTCGPLLSWNNTATPGTIILGNAVAGNFCVQVYDVGNLAAGAQTNYAMEVTHYLGIGERPKAEGRKR